MRRAWPIALAMCTIAVGAAPATATAARLNVVLIIADDLNNALGCYGHRVVKSPNIDRLAARGVRFDRAYCQYPLCNPSRVSLLSGRRPDATGVMDLETPPRTRLKDVVFLPQYFRQHGYRSVHIGKIFHTGPAFEDPSSWDVEIRETGKHPPESAIVRSRKIERPQKYGIEYAVLNSTDAETADGVVARQASAMLKDLSAAGQPFFAAVGFRRPHAPYAAPQKYFDLYPPESISPLDEPAGHLASIPQAAFTYPPGTRPISLAERQECAAAYYASISFVDAQVGVVLDALDALDLWKNTVVVFTSDHGYHLGEHGGMWHKMSLFEESARVPLAVASPRLGIAGRACAGTVELLDIYPTLVELCGLPAVAELEGKSLVPLLRDPNRAWSEVAYTQVLRGAVMGRSVRDARWRYTEWGAGAQGAELYDHDADPREYVNLAQDAKLAGVRSRLQALLRFSARPNGPAVSQRRASP
jgi:iduronate 2-sulfatase